MSRDRWSSQGDYDYQYATSGSALFFAGGALAALYAVLVVRLRRHDPFTVGAALVTGWGMLLASARGAPALRVVRVA